MGMLRLHSCPPPCTLPLSVLLQCFPLTSSVAQVAAKVLLHNAPDGSRGNILSEPWASPEPWSTRFDCS